MRCVEPVRLLESRGYDVEKRNVQRMSREDLERVASAFRTDEELVENMVHEKKRDAVAGLSRPEILDRMGADYTFVNRPVAIRDGRVACGPLRLNQACYDEMFP